MAGVAALTVAEILAHWTGLGLAAVYPFADHLFWMQFIDSETRAFYQDQEEQKDTDQPGGE